MMPPGLTLPRLTNPTILPAQISQCRYASYCANVARTYFVDPNKEQEAQYAALQEAQAAAVAALVEGAPMSAAYEAVVATLKVSQRSCMVRPRVCCAVNGAGCRSSS